MSPCEVMDPQRLEQVDTREVGEGHSTAALARNASSGFISAHGSAKVSSDGATLFSRWTYVIASIHIASSYRVVGLRAA